MRMSLKQIRDCTGAEVIVAPLDLRSLATGISWDSRMVKPGDVYLALPGEHVDGHSFVTDALSNGAVCVLVMQTLSRDTLLVAREMGAAVFEVADTAHALVDMADFWRTQLRGRVIALTGSAGKTTTKNLIRDVVASTYKTVATQGNQNNELGVPNTILASDTETEVIVVEMGMRGLGQISSLCSYVRPDWGVITNIGESHLELLGSRENIARAKSELLLHLPEGRGRAFLNGADDFTQTIIADTHLATRRIETVIFTGQDEREVDGSAAAGQPSSEAEAVDPTYTHVWASDITLDDQGRPQFILHCQGFFPPGNPFDVDAQATIEQSYNEGDALTRDEASYVQAEFLEETAQVHLALRGVHNVANACAAAAVGRSLGIPLATCAEALEHSLPEAGRMEFLKARGGYQLIHDAYNANPESMIAALTLLDSLKVPGRRVAVLGDMGELGTYEEACHVGVGAAAATKALDRLICVGTRAAWIAQGAKDAGMDPDKIIETQELSVVLGDLDTYLEPGDAVLVKASHFMGLERVVEGLVR